MSISVEESGDGGSKVRVFIGPNPGIWTGIAFCCLGLITGIMFLCILGGVQLGLGMEAWGLQLAGILMALLVCLWFGSRIGYRLAAPQTQQLRAVLEGILN